MKDESFARSFPITGSIVEALLLLTLDFAWIFDQASRCQTVEFGLSNCNLQLSVIPFFNIFKCCLDQSKNIFFVNMSLHYCDLDFHLEWCHD